MSSHFDGIIRAAMDDMRERSRKRIYKRDPEAWMADILGRRLYSKQQEMLHSYLTTPRTAAKSSNGVGKDLPLDTPIPTPLGWTTIGELRVGDEVFDEAGRPTRIVAKSEVFHNPLYRIVFSDGAEVVCSGTHQWDTIDFRKASRLRQLKVADWREHWDSAETRTTEDIAASLMAGRGSSKNHLVPINGALQMPDVELPVDPYLLGVWLGDGHSDAAGVTLGNEKLHVVEKLRSRGVKIEHGKAEFYWSLAWQGLVDDLRAIGVYGNKHIPVEYLRASEGQRRELLAGLMDTDGFAIHNSVVGMDLMNKQLADGFAELVRSLGMRVSVKPGRTYLNGRNVGTRYRMSFSPRGQVFSPDSPKAQRWESPTAQVGRPTARTIVSVEPVPTVPTQCIQVDSDRRLYLATQYMIPTHNSQLVADTITWEAATADPLDDLCIVSAPTLSQIEKVIFAYMKANKGTAKVNGINLPGRITETLAWKVDDVDGIEGSGLLVFGKRPSDKDIISSFQGTRKLRTKVFLDEAGGLPLDMFDAAEAVLTGADSRLFAIGNPDRRGTYFHRIFTDPKISPEWSLHTINSFDLPSFTGEKVYDDPDKQARFVAALTSPEWVENKKRTWGEDSARYKSKVLGEFPEEGDNSFFSQLAIDRAYDTTIEDDASEPPIIGVDIARFGSDENRMIVNRNGLIREYDDGTPDGGAWSKTDLITTARKIHEAANRIGAWLVNIDANGVGGGVIDALTTLEEFEHATYAIGAIYGSNASPDNHRWFNARAYQYDHLRTLMMEGKVDLDYDDEQLRDELISQTYKFDRRGAIQITSKDEMRSKGLKSPDTLDAVVLSVIDFREEETETDLKPGTVVTYSDLIQEEEHAFYTNSYW